MRTSPSSGRMIAILACVAQVAGCSLMLRAAGYPPEATRKSPPSGIESRALAAGAAFPRTVLTATTGDVRFEPGKRHVLIFYRGAW